MKRFHLLVVVMIVATMAACGDDTTPASDSSATSSSTTAPAETTTTAEVTTTTGPTTTTTTAPTEPLAVWASDTTNGVVVSFDPVSLDVLTETDVGSGAESFAFGAGSAWVVGNADGVVYRIDAETGELLATVEAAPNTAGIVFDEGLVFASNFGTGPDFAASVTVIDPSTNTVVDTLDVGAGATGMTNGSAVGVTFESGEIYRIMGTPGAFEVERAQVGDGLSELTAADDHFFVTGISTGMLHKIDLTSLGLVDSAATGSSPNFIDFDGTDLWVTDSAGSVLRVDPDTMAATDEASIPSPTGVDTATIDGTTWVFVASWSGGVYRMDAADPAGTMIPALMAAGPVYDVAISGAG